MKKILLVSIMFLLFAGVVSASSINGDYKGNPIVKITSNGKALESDEVPPMIFDGHTVVPISLLRQLGASVKWNQDTYNVDVSLPQVNLSTTPDVDKLMKTFGKSGLNLVYQVIYSSLGDGVGQLQFSLNIKTSDRSKDKDYNTLMNSAVETNVMEIRIDYSDGFSSFIQTKDTKDYWAGKITSDEYVSKIKVVNNNVAPQQKITPISNEEVIESSIDGNFEGWTGDTLFKLTNGQIWQQSSFAYTYHYAYSPKVTIFKDGIVYKMQVDGVDDKITVKRIK